MKVFPLNPTKFAELQQSDVPVIGDTMEIASVMRQPDEGKLANYMLAIKLQTVRGSVCYLVESEALSAALDLVCSLGGASKDRAIKDHSASIAHHGRTIPRVPQAVDREP